jgi:hypothetical protein
MNSVSDKISGWTRWVGQQVVGRNDFRGKEQARSRDYAVLGAASGAVAGAAIGVVAGFDSQKSTTIKEVWVGRDITHPQMNGYSHHASPDYSTECLAKDAQGSCTSSRRNLDGWYHTYTPNISERVVGHFSEPTFRNTNFLEPLMGGALGAVGGGLLGLGVGLGVAALQRTLTRDNEPEPEKPKLSPEAQQALHSRAGAAALGGGILGTVVGTYAGSQAGLIELAAKQVHSRAWDIPVFETQTLGHVPGSHYEYNLFGSTWASPSGGRSYADVPVNRSVPLYDRAGNPRLQVNEEVFNTNRYGPIFGGIAGGMIGAGVGLAAGLVIGVGDKLLSERSAAKIAPA